MAILVAVSPEQQGRELGVLPMGVHAVVMGLHT